MNYNDKYELIFYAPMRTGTRAIYTILKQVGFVCNSNNYNSHDHSTPSDKIEEDLTKKHYKTICSIRNPYSRQVSNWNLYRLHINDQTFTFENFIEDVFINKKLDFQAYYHKGLENNPPDYLIRCENMYEDIIKIPCVIENYELLKNDIENVIKNNEYDEVRLNTNKSNNYWKEFYNEELANIVYNNLKDQFEMFNYKKDSWL